MTVTDTAIRESPVQGLDASKLAGQLERLAAELGIRRWDLGAACSTDTSVQVDRGEPKQLKGAQRSSITVRVWNADGLVGITSTSDLSAAGLARALAGAQEASAYGNADDTPTFSPLATAPLETLDQPLREPVGILSLLATLQEAERDLLSRHVAISTVPYNGLAQRSSERIYLNSDGACRQQRLSTASLYLYARAEEAGRKPRSSGAVRLAYGAGLLDVAGCIDEAAERTISHLDYAPIDTGRYPCVFSPEAFLDLIGAFSSLFNARSVLDGVSLSQRESIGEQLAVPFLSIHDNGLHPGNIGASSFDGEGTPVHRLALVDGGVEAFPALGSHRPRLRRGPHRPRGPRCQGVCGDELAGDRSGRFRRRRQRPGSSQGGWGGLDRVALGAPCRREGEPGLLLAAL